MFAELFDEHAHPLHRYLARRVGVDVADDLVSETFLAAMRAKETYDPEKGSVVGWLYGIATNLLRGHAKRETRLLRTAERYGIDLGVAETLEHTVVTRIDARAHLRRIAGALAKMQNSDRDLLLLVSLAGLSVQEAAEALDLNPGTARSRLHRLRAKLKEVEHA
ncbi:sigma-70 family RNA polymerase sigma factor [Lentzea sp. BCCO 10_0856]|uniref:Sigma-70 family RNA polymerase sigma factor n=1 Tax=Lentzea miocenica TaxID=3095431 RepID=A0ABU4T0G6_9PSEU|nr:sigma-70 family RNA polymerase sigma factor [Lentzea sp. BCCO 10_0856]MDX8031653.1 sigma-70 family RNA polymerase sigma factor [Lentzea sp. BCCO 10_0856]